MARGGAGARRPGRPPRPRAPGLDWTKMSGGGRVPTTITLSPGLDPDLLAIGQRLLPEGFRLEIVPRGELAARLPEVEYLLSMGAGWLEDEQLAGAKRL